MNKIRDGVEYFKTKDRLVLITPELKRAEIPLNYEFPPSDIKQLPRELIKLLKSKDIIVDSTKKKKNLSNQLKGVLKTITFKDIQFEKIDLLVQEFLKNCSISPVITIDCSFKVTSKFLDIINEKYNENSINPVVKIFIREEFNRFIEKIEQYIHARESIELNTLIIILDYTLLNEEIIKEVKKRINPLEIFIYYNEIPDTVTKLDELCNEYHLPVLLEINKKTEDLEIKPFKNLPLYFNDDSIFRLISTLKLRFSKKQAAFKEFFSSLLAGYLIFPYCTACNSRLFIEGDGNIYACNTGFQAHDILCTLNNQSLEEILNSKEMEDLRNRIEEKSNILQQKSCLSNFISGCLYEDRFKKFELMKKILLLYI